MNEWRGKEGRGNSIWQLHPHTQKAIGSNRVAFSKLDGCGCGRHSGLFCDWCWLMSLCFKLRSLSPIIFWIIGTTLGRSLSEYCKALTLRKQNKPSINWIRNEYFSLFNYKRISRSSMLLSVTTCLPEHLRAQECTVRGMENLTGADGVQAPLLTWSVFGFWKMKNCSLIRAPLFKNV